MSSLPFPYLSKLYGRSKCCARDVKKNSVSFVAVNFSVHNLTSVVCEESKYFIRENETIEPLDYFPGVHEVFQH